MLLKPYRMENVQRSILEVLRKNINFPDPQKIAVLCESVEPAQSELISAKSQQHPYGDVAWMAPYIRKNAAKITEEDAEKIHAAGLLTWGEAEKRGLEFAAWNQEYRKKFPVGLREE